MGACYDHLSYVERLSIDEGCRVNKDRIRNICELGERTRGWSFANRKLGRPEKPEVRLSAPSGAVWVWSEGAAEQA